MLSKQRPYSVEKRIARRQHAYGTAALLHDVGRRLVERAGPWPTFTADQRCRELKLSPTKCSLNVPVALTEALSNAIFRGNGALSRYR